MQYHIKIYLKNKRLHWCAFYTDGRAALHAAFAQLERHIGDGVPFGLSIFPQKPKEAPCV